MCFAGLLEKGGEGGETQHMSDESRDKKAERREKKEDESLQRKEMRKRKRGSDERDGGHNGRGA